jgi:4-hydroxy-tetrahydrodipicolinate synthase
VATAIQARAWAHETLRGIGNSLYTPFSGPDGDDIDWDAYRTLVRYCVGELRHPMLWCTSGIAEFWSLTLDERKRLLEVAIEEGRAANPDVVVQACTAAMAAKDCLELTRHAQQAGADIVYIQTPMMEAHGGEGVLNFFRYIVDRTDIALGMFNSPSSGYVLTPAESARIYDEIRAVCATKEGAFRPASSRLLHELAPELVIWECDTTVYRAGWLRAGIVGPAQLGTAGYLYETPQQPILSEYWKLIWNDKLSDAIDYAETSGLDQFGVDMRSWFTCYPGRSDYFTHWGGAFKYAASVLGLPVGDFPHSRPPQARLPDEGRAQIRAAYQRFGLVE